MGWEDVASCYTGAGRLWFRGLSSWYCRAILGFGGEWFCSKKISCMVCRGGTTPASYPAAHRYLRRTLECGTSLAVPRPLTLEAPATGGGYFMNYLFFCTRPRRQARRLVLSASRFVGVNTFSYGFGWERSEVRLCPLHLVTPDWSHWHLVPADVLQMFPFTLRPCLLQIGVWLQVFSRLSTAWSGVCARGAVGGCPGVLVLAERLWSAAKGGLKHKKVKSCWIVEGRSTLR